MANLLKHVMKPRAHARDPCLDLQLFCLQKIYTSEASDVETDTRTDHFT